MAHKFKFEIFHRANPVHAVFIDHMPASNAAHGEMSSSHERRQRRRQRHKHNIRDSMGKSPVRYW